MRFADGVLQMLELPMATLFFERAKFTRIEVR
jgi:hypothetical protein